MNILVFVKDLIIATLGQMIYLFGGVFLFGLSINLVSHLTFNSLANSLGSKGTYLAAWLGVPIHELGHALFCIPFMHRIVKIEFFKPDPLTGTLGYVSHTWNRSNPWQVMGNFFIGIGPIILGCALLLALFYLLVPDGSEALTSILVKVNEVNESQSISSYLAIVGSSSFVMVSLLLTGTNASTWQFWVFVYLSFCIASNIRLSWSDIKHTLSGFLFIIVLFLLINLLGYVDGFAYERYSLFIASSLGVTYSLLILALSIALTGFTFTYLVLAAYVKIRHGRLLKPF